jgi:hypothetical protein
VPTPIQSPLKPVYTPNSIQMQYNTLNKRLPTWQPVGLPRFQQTAPLYYQRQGTNFRHLAAQHLQAEQVFQTPSVNHV